MRWIRTQLYSAPGKPLESIKRMNFRQRDSYLFGPGEIKEAGISLLMMRCHFMLQLGWAKTQWRLDGQFKQTKSGESQEDRSAFSRAQWCQTWSVRTRRFMNYLIVFSLVVQWARQQANFLLVLIIATSLWCCAVLQADWSTYGELA